MDVQVVSCPNPIQRIPMDKNTLISLFVNGWAYQFCEYSIENCGDPTR